MLTWIKSVGLGKRIIAITIVILVVAVAVNYLVFVQRYTKSAQASMVDRAAAFTAVAEEAKNHVAGLAQAGTFDQPSLMADLQQTLKAGRPYTDAKIFGTLPIVAGWTAAQKAAEHEHLEFHVLAFEARNKKNEPKPGTFEANLLKDLSQQFASRGDDSLHRIDAASNTLHYVKAIKLSADCMTCHGKPGNQGDPDNDGRDILGFPMESWEVGDMHGAYHVVMPMAPVDEQVASFITNGLSWTFPLLIGSTLLFVWLLRRMFAKPVSDLIERVRLIQDSNDLTQRVTVTSRDEVGQLGDCFNSFVSTLNDVLVQVTDTTREVASAATEIAASSEEMAAGMGEQTQQVTQISSAVEEMSASIVEVARKSGDAAGNATESGKVAQSGGRVVQQTIEGMQAISQAVSSSAASVQELGKRGEQIGQIIEVINDIADQTNLLALNAAIEAAPVNMAGALR